MTTRQEIRADAIWTNLTLLGYSATQNEPGISEPAFTASKQSFFASMSSGIGTSYKLMESVFAFLLKKRDEKDFKEKFHNCWPIVERTSQAKEFRNQVFRILEQLKRDGHFPADFSPRRSDLDECRGERFEKIIFYLSSLVLLGDMEKRHNSAGSGLQDRSAVLGLCEKSGKVAIGEKKKALKILNAHIQLQAEKFLAKLKQRVDFFSSAQSITDQLVLKYSELKNQQNIDENNVDTFHTPTSDEIAGIVESVSTSLGSLEENFSAEKSRYLLKNLNLICSSLNQMEALDLSGLAETMSIPNEFHTLLDGYLTKHGINLIDNNGVLDMGSLLKIFNLSLDHHLYQRNSLDPASDIHNVFRKSGISKISNEISSVNVEKLQEILGTLETSTDAACTLLEKSDKIKTQLDRSIDSISPKNIRLSSAMEEDLRLPNPVTIPKIDLMAALPPSNHVSSFQRLQTKDNIFISTPEAVSKYKNRLAQAVAPTPASSRRLSKPRRESIVGDSSVKKQPLSARKTLSSGKENTKNTVPLNSLKEKLSSLKSKGSSQIDKLSERIAAQALGDTSAKETLKSPLKCLDERALKGKSLLPSSPKPNYRVIANQSPKTILRPMQRTPSKKTVGSVKKQLRFNIPSSIPASPSSDYNPAADMSVVNPALFDASIMMDMNSELPPF